MQWCRQKDETIIFAVTFTIRLILVFSLTGRCNLHMVNKIICRVISKRGCTWYDFHLTVGRFCFMGWADSNCHRLSGWMVTFALASIVFIVKSIFGKQRIHGMVLELA